MRDHSKSMVDTFNKMRDNLKEMGDNTKRMKACPESFELTSKSLAELYFVRCHIRPLMSRTIN